MLGFKQHKCRVTRRLNKCERDAALDLGRMLLNVRYIGAVRLAAFKLADMPPRLPDRGSAAEMAVIKARYTPVVYVGAFAAVRQALIRGGKVPCRIKWQMNAVGQYIVNI